MKYELINDEFCKRFYKWRLLDAEREVSESFPLLTKMKNPYMQRNLASLFTFSSHERRTIVHTLIKRTLKPQLLSDIGDCITHEELELLKSYLVRKNKVTRENPDIKKMFNVNEKSSFKEFKVKDLKAIILDRLNDSLDSTPKFRDSSSIRYEQTYNRWTISTSVDCERICYYYNQQVYTYDNQERIILGGRCNISLNEWLGFRNDSTWCFVSEEDPLTTAKIISDLCIKFISVFPSLLGESCQ